MEGSYLFVEIAAQRCAQLMRGAKPKVDIRAHKFTTIATEETSQELVPWELRSPEEIAAEEAAVAAAAAAEADEEAAQVAAEEQPAEPGDPDEKAKS